MALPGRSLRVLKRLFAIHPAYSKGDAEPPDLREREILCFFGASSTFDSPQVSRRQQNMRAIGLIRTKNRLVSFAGPESGWVVGEDGRFAHFPLKRKSRRGS